MASDLTVEAVRTALDLSRTRAEVAGWNIVNASIPGATFFVVDQAGAKSALAMAAGSDRVAGGQLLAAVRETGLSLIEERSDAVRPSLDELVADSVAAGLEYQLLSESLGRHFGLMRLAVSGRGGA